MKNQDEDLLLKIVVLWLLVMLALLALGTITGDITK
jgi:hypothetical protein